jgi:hypothetical protein
VLREAAMASPEDNVHAYFAVRSGSMFFHVKELQYEAKPERPDPIYAKKLQEILGGEFGEMTVMMSYLFQGWNGTQGNSARHA